MEEWIAHYWWQVGTLLVILISFYWRTRYMIKLLEHHLDLSNKAPHPQCPTHSAEINTVVNGFRELKEQVKKMDDRIFDYLKKNGHNRSGR